VERQGKGQEARKLLKGGQRGGTLLQPKLLTESLIGCGRQEIVRPMPAPEYHKNCEGAGKQAKPAPPQTSGEGAGEILSPAHKYRDTTFLATNRTEEVGLQLKISTEARKISPGGAAACWHAHYGCYNHKFS